MLLGFKTELKVNNQERTQLAKHCGVARHAWNWGLWLTKNILDHNKANPQDKLKFPTAVDLHKLLVAMVKPECPWYYEVSKCAPQYALRQLSEAWKQAFKKIKQPPRFKKKGRTDSFTVDGSLAVDHLRVKIPVIGWIKTYERLPVDRKPKSFTISRTADKWFVSWILEIEPLAATQQLPIVGVDLGLKTLATLSTGEVFEGAKSYRKYQKKLSRLQWLNRHKVKGSHNWKKAQIKIARLHRKIANIRFDTLHKLTFYLANNHSKIGIEDLNVSGMLSNHKLAKAIADMSFYEFRRQLEYKCQLYGSELVVVDRWFPSSKTCSECRTVKETLSLAQRVFKCDHCGLEIDRDLNASMNLETAVS
ncbi:MULTISPECIES: RNA-guided endonuclease TnpB family protein [unclassified Microcoleus]|uniref:RNA-guided endonuclease TnpB family protein n=1 Tax=unclassified Microcoleus TaxID=2642155 RepID=UPI002FD41EB0